MTSEMLDLGLAWAERTPRSRTYARRCPWCTLQRAGDPAAKNKGVAMVLHLEEFPDRSD